MAVCRTMPRLIRPINVVELMDVTLEERLHRALDDFRLLSDLFELQSVVTDPTDYALSTSGSSALARFCRRASDDLRLLVDTLPTETLSDTLANRSGRLRNVR